jgi:hypothetical protein
VAYEYRSRFGKKLTHQSEFKENETMNSDRRGISNGVHEERRRREFLRGLSDDFAALRDREGAWHDEIAERFKWDLTQADDLEKRVVRLRPRQESRPLAPGVCQGG